jgi:hypothetical protein
VKGIAQLEAQLAVACKSPNSSINTGSLSSLASINVTKPRPPVSKAAAQVQIPPSMLAFKKKPPAAGRKASGRAVVIHDSNSESDSDSELVPPLVKYRYQIQEYGTDGFAEGEMRVDADLSEAQNQWRCSGKIPHGYQPNWGYKFAHEPQGKKPINFGNSATKYQEILSLILQNHKDLHNKIPKMK